MPSKTPPQNLKHNTREQNMCMTTCRIRRHPPTCDRIVYSIQNDGFGKDKRGTVKTCLDRDGCNSLRMIHHACGCCSSLPEVNSHSTHHSDTAWRRLDSSLLPDDLKTNSSNIFF